ncbi:cytoplasmic protein [Cryptococcus neoformans]|nr:cytoplasmic protein [Cryptococcus neoformans var. grubii Th84]OXG72719.1 cytoplasmic protein [Cryptococcus neoformans var. grubii MW-RSA36]OXH01285.1 cytoplasmic protein [Cryptococcus neoformans var. grubii]OXL05542.1 cytoplasmic protein [Cryptococcus neoformans var. grubii Gb118]OXH23394.1 cytoplasmic protein [Cryptococcus neoformans var. grubii]
MASLTELFQFLDSPNPSARHLALQNLIGHTPKNSTNRNIFIPSSFAGNITSGSGLVPNKRKDGSDEDEIKIKALKDLTYLCMDQAPIAHDALSALINLSDNPVVARHIVDKEFLVWLVSYTANTTSPLSPLTSMLLSNITSHPSLIPNLANLTIPIIPLPKSTHYPPYFLPASGSASSTIHPDFRDPTIGLANAEAGQEPEREIEAVRALVQAFEDGASDGVKEGTGKRKGDCNFLASVFANISMAPVTRQLLLTPRPPFPQPAEATPSEDDEPLLSKIVVYTGHPDTIRRGGALGCIKNCAMDRASMSWLLASEEDRVRLPSDPTRMIKGVDVLPWVLAPLMGSEEYDIDEMDKLPPTLQFLPPEKERERDPVLRMMCVEILLLLATTFTGREALRNRGVYYVVREHHKVETDQQIKDSIERLVGLLQRDESRDTKQDHIEELVRGAVKQEAEEEEMGELDVIEV